MRCTSYCTAEYYDIDNLAKFLRIKGMEPKFFDEVIHIGMGAQGEETDVFFFPYGCIIVWENDEEDNDINLLQEVKPFETSPLARPIEDICSYHYNEAEGETEKTFINEEEDDIVLESNDKLVKLSLSHGFAQSVKLTGLEESVARTIKSTRFLSDELATSGKILLSRRKLAQQIGSLFAERNSINLHSDILDTPEFFWRRPRYEQYYNMAAEYMDIKTRIDILNKRLDVIHELYQILSEELNHAHSSRLELTIICLIVMEVVLVLLKDFFHWV